jgi:DNA-binding XRE family transcriptional regulator
MSYDSDYKLLNMNLSSQLAKNIRKRRGELSFRTFARRIGMSSRTIWRIENEEQNVTIKTLQHLMKVFRCNVEDLFKDDN